MKIKKQVSCLKKKHKMNTTDTTQLGFLAKILILSLHVCNKTNLYLKDRDKKLAGELYQVLNCSVHPLRIKFYFHEIAFRCLAKIATYSSIQSSLISESN